MEPMQAEMKESDIKKFACVCDKLFMSLSGLNRDMKTCEAAGGSKQFVCDKCSKVFGQNCSMKYHSLSQHKDIQEVPFASAFHFDFDKNTARRNFQCKHCPKNFRSTGTANAHLKTCHNMMFKASRGKKFMGLDTE